MGKYTKQTAALKAITIDACQVKSKQLIIKKSDGEEKDLESVIETATQLDSKLDSIEAQISTNTENIESLSNEFNQSVHVTSTWHNGYNWYRKYSDGFIEQGGRVASLQQDTYQAGTVTLHTPFSNTNYNVQLTQFNNSQQLGENNPNNTQSVYSKATGSFVIASWAWTYGVDWYACGY